MRTFRRYLAVEAGRAINKRNLALFVLFLLFCFYFVQVGVRQYKKIPGNKAEFLETEKADTKLFINYTQYGLYGFRLMFVPSPLSAIFSNSGVVPELTAFVDSGVRLRLYHSVMGKNLYAENLSGFNDFAGVILLFGSLLAMFLGFDIFAGKEFLKYLAGFIDYKRLYTLIVSVRLSVLALLALFVVCCALLQVWLNGIIFTAGEYYHVGMYLLMTVLLLWCFFFMGAAAGGMRGKTTGITAVAVLWFVFVFLIPGTVSRIVSEKSDGITSAYNLEQEKLKIMTDFERAALKRMGRYTTVDEKKESDRRAAERYWNTELKEIQKIESRMGTETMESLALFRRLSLFSPISLWRALVCEIDGRGYSNILEFYVYSQNLKQRFIRYYFDKKYSSNYEAVESFVKAEENIFYASAALPANTTAGGVVLGLYILLFLGLSFYGFRRMMFDTRGAKDDELDALDLELKKGETYVLITNGNQTANGLYRFFSGRSSEFKGKVLLDERQVGIAPADGENNEPPISFSYVCGPGDLPGDLRVGH
ncbi:MAG: hypothetical protein GY765_13250, partial [bacterium]|nr:hypothetical protein [bacterium]